MDEPEPVPETITDVQIVMAELKSGTASVGLRFNKQETVQFAWLHLPLAEAAKIAAGIARKEITSEQIAARDWHAVRVPLNQGQAYTRKVFTETPKQPPISPVPDEIERGGLAVLRQDGKVEQRAAAIRKDWRAWANRQGYHQRLRVPVSAGRLSVALEVWQGPAPDRFLLYHPAIPNTTNTESIIILPDKETLETHLDLARQMARLALQTAQARDQMIAEQKAQQN